MFKQVTRKDLLNFKNSANQMVYLRRDNILFAKKTKTNGGIGRLDHSVESRPILPYL